MQRLNDFITQETIAIGIIHEYLRLNSMNSFFVRGEWADDFRTDQAPYGICLNLFHIQWLTCLNNTSDWTCLNPIIYGTVKVR